MTDFVSVPLEEARTGDHMLQAGTWVAMSADATFPTDGMVTIWWNGGGSMTFPISHRPPVRRIATLLVCSECGQGHYATDGFGLWACTTAACDHVIGWHDVTPEADEYVTDVAGLLAVAATSRFAKAGS